MRYSTIARELRFLNIAQVPFVLMALAFLFVMALQPQTASTISNDRMVSMDLG